MGFALSDLALTSPSFENGSPIPLRHTGFGENTSPGLRWSGLPEATSSMAVVCVDPDAPFLSSDGSVGLAHWVLYNIPPEVDGLPQGVGGSQFTCGPNQMGTPDYAGPQPPQGHGDHHYYFWLLALDAGPNLDGGLGFRELIASVEPHVLGMNRLVGTFCAPTG